MEVFHNGSRPPKSSRLFPTTVGENLSEMGWKLMVFSAINVKIEHIYNTQILIELLRKKVLAASNNKIEHSPKIAYRDPVPIKALRITIVPANKTTNDSLFLGAA
jgi:hypothetical protein